MTKIVRNAKKAGENLWGRATGIEVLRREWVDVGEGRSVSTADVSPEAVAERAASGLWYTLIQAEGVCPACGGMLVAGARYCPWCGNAPEPGWVCSCGELNPAQGQYCYACGGIQPATGRTRRLSDPGDQIG